MFRYPGFTLFEARNSFYKAKSGRDSGLNVCAGGRVANITLGITGLPGILGWDYGIEELYWGPSKH